MYVSNQKSIYTSHNDKAQRRHKFPLSFKKHLIIVGNLAELSSFLFLRAKAPLGLVRVVSE